MESPSSAIAAGDGLAARNEEVTSFKELKGEVSSSTHTLANGLHDYRFMKNGKPRPSAVRDFPKNIVPANRISDAVLEMKQASASSKAKTEQKQIKEDLIAPETDKSAEANSDNELGKEEKGSTKKLYADQKLGKVSTLSSKKPQEEIKKQGLASPDMAKPIKKKDAPTEKIQKTPMKLGMPTDKKRNAIASTISDEAEAEPNKGKGVQAERSQIGGKSVDKKAGFNASSLSDASPQEAEMKSNKGKAVSTEKTQKMPIKLGKSIVKKLSASASTVSDASPKKLKEVEAELNKEKDVPTEKIQKIGKSVEKKANDKTSTVADVSLQGAEQELVSSSQGEMEAMDIDKQEDEEELCIENEQGKQKEENSQEETQGEKSRKLHPVKRKSGIRDLPDGIKQTKEKDAKKDHVAQDLDMKHGVREKVASDNTKFNSNGKKKRPREEPDPSERSKKLSKSKPLDVAQTSGKAKESSSLTETLVVTPKATKPIKKSSTPSESGKKVRRSPGKSLKPTTMIDVGDSRKLVLESLRLFDAVRRKFVQDEEKNGKPQRGARADLQAATLLKDHNASRGVEKAQGSFPGVLVGDIFLFRTELSFARVHGPIQAGIEYLTAKESEYGTPVAISIISNVGQDGEDNGEELIYTGQGGRSADNKQIADQKLERGNLALDGSQKFNVPVRVIRGIKDVLSPTGKIYVYDGLYKVEETYTEKGSGGFDEYKFRLRRMSDQPELGSVTLKLAADLKSQALSARKDIVVADISNGKESRGICVENTVDDDKGPAPFQYSTRVIYPDDMENLESSIGCKCKGACSPSSSCSCFSKNGDELPYLNGGYLVRQKDYIFECGSKCSCSSTCRNRATEKGLKFHLDMFKTVDRGWGVRSLDTIPAGSFVCEYIGKLVSDEEETRAVGDREHLLFTRRLPDTTPRWGDVPSIIPDRSPSTVRPDVGNPELIIDASSIGNVARFINHSCSPNLLVQKVLSKHQDVRYPQFKLFALDNIPPLTELTFDYGHPSDQELVSELVSIECLCGSIECRGKLYL